MQGRALEAVVIAGIYILVNIVVLAMYGIDKWKAIRHKWRIPESALLTAALFGVFGALAGMILFRHKIRKPKFYILVPMILVFELAAVFVVLKKGL